MSHPRSGLPDATAAWVPFDAFVNALRDAAQAATEANAPNTVLSRNMMPHDHTYIADMKVRIATARERYEGAAVHLEAMEAQLKRHTADREEY